MGISDRELLELAYERRLYRAWSSTNGWKYYKTHASTTISPDQQMSKVSIVRLLTTGYLVPQGNRDKQWLTTTHKGEFARTGCLPIAEKEF